MTRWVRIADCLLMAYYGAVLTLMLLPVFVFMAALKVADWLDRCSGGDDN